MVRDQRTLNGALPTLPPAGGAPYGRAMASDGTGGSDDDVLWRPSAERIEGSVLRAYLDALEVREGRPFPDHDALWAWSVGPTGSG